MRLSLPGPNSWLFYFSNSRLLSNPPCLSSPSFFPAESELTLRHLWLFSIAGLRVCVSGESVCCVLGLSVAAGDALGPGARPFASHCQAFLEALWGEVVDHRIQAAVEAGQAQSDGVKSSGKALHGTVSQGLGPHQGVQEEDRVVRNKADDEDAQMHQNHPQDTSLAVTAMINSHRAPQRPQNKRGTHQVGQEGEKEAHDLGNK